MTSDGHPGLLDNVSTEMEEVFADLFDSRALSIETFLRGRVLTCVMHDHFDATKPTTRERSAALAGLRARRHLVLRDRAAARIETLTGRTVVGTLGDDDPDTDYAVDVFILDAPVTAPPGDDGTLTEMVRRAATARRDARDQVARARAVAAHSPAPPSGGPDHPHLGARRRALVRHDAEALGQHEERGGVGRARRPLS